MKRGRRALRGMRLPSAALSLVAIAACGHPPAPVAPVATSPLPTELRVPGITEYRGNPRLIADRIYVLGRTKTRIAYLLEPGDEACGCYTPEIVVEDLRAGRILWKDSYDSDELDPKKARQLRNLDDLWRARGADWDRHLREQGIVREPTPVLESLPPPTHVPRLAITTQAVDEASSNVGFAHLTSYQIDLVTASETTTIRRSTDEWNLLDVEVVGYLPSVDDGPAAVLVREDHRGWEGPPSVQRLRFVGADFFPDGR